MKVTKENISKIEYFADYKKQGISLNKSQDMLNELVKVLEKDINDGFPLEKHLYINYEDKHTEYSPERVDPCPDYYGCFTLRLESDPYEIIGDYMTLEGLDEAMLLLSNYRDCVLGR